MRTLLDDLYDKKERVEIEIREIRKELRKARASAKRVETKIVNKRIEQEELKDLLNIRDNVKQRKPRARKDTEPKTLPKGKGESDRGTARDERIQEREDNQGIQRRGRKNRPKKGEEGRADEVVQGEVDSNHSVPNEGENGKVRKRTGANRKPRVSSKQEDKPEDSYYIKRVSRKARKGQSLSDGEGEGEVSSTESELE